jgi:hypothetical protein
MNNINEEGYYIGSEVRWNVEDVEIFAQANDMEFSQEDYKRILNATFEDNEYLMNMIQECIATTIDFMLENGELKLKNDD